MKLSPHPHLPFVAFLAVLLSCSGDSPTETAPTPAQVQASAGSGQAGIAEMPLAAELVARVTDPKGRLVPGVTVSWTVAPEAGTLSATATQTDSRGEARTRWTLGPAAGTFTVTASAAGLAPAVFTATAAPAPPARVEKMGGDGQTGAPAGQLRDSLAVRVASAQGRPVAGAAVGWVVASGGGTLSASTTVTDAAGIAKVAWTLGAEGQGMALAGVGSLAPATFNATAVRVASVAISQTSGTVGRGETLRLTATPRDAAGNPLAGRPVQWSSSSPSIASVSDAGVVTGLASGVATITATSEGRTATTALRVTSDDRTPPKLKGLSVSPASVDVTSGPAYVNLAVSATDAGSGMAAFTVSFHSQPVSAGISCGTRTSAGGVLASGSPADGVWKCTATIPKGAPAGAWHFQVTLQDSTGNQASYFGRELRELGAPDSMVVVNSGPSTAPSITALALSPTGVDVSEAAATVDVLITATAREGVAYVYADATTGRGAEYSRSCQVWVPSGEITTSGTWKCRLTIPGSAPAGTWNVSTIAITDRAGTTRFFHDELKAPGFVSTFQVTSRTEDLAPPTLTAFSLSAGTLDLSTGPKSVEATVTATDAETGIVRAQVMLRAPISGVGACASDLLDGRAKTATMKCTMTFGQSAPSGTWRVEQVVLYDVVGNLRSYNTAQLQAAGFQSTLTVTR